MKLYIIYSIDSVKHKVVIFLFGNSLEVSGT